MAGELLTITTRSAGLLWSVKGSVDKVADDRPKSATRASTFEGFWVAVTDPTSHPKRGMRCSRSRRKRRRTGNPSDAAVPISSFLRGAHPYVTLRCTYIPVAPEHASSEHRRITAARYGMNWRIPRSRWGALLVAGIIMASTVVGSAAPAAQAQAAQESFAITVPPVPDDIKVPAGNKVFLVGHAIGTQNYVCLPSGKDFKFTLFTPQATLFSDDGRQLMTHYFSPNPFEGGTIRATWQDSRDTSTVWAQATNSSSDPNFVAPGAIAWVLLQRAGSQDGPDGGDTLTGTPFVQRLSTSGGVAPSTGCKTSNDVGHPAFVPYTADYFFYTNAA